MKFVLLLAFLCSLMGSAGQSEISPDGTQTFVKLEEALKRLGETGYANRLSEYKSQKRLRFAALAAGTNAEVGAALGNWGPIETNVLSFASVYENFGRRTTSDRPWNPKMDWVGLASTVVHEDRHMGQYMPTRTPAHEDRLGGIRRLPLAGGSRNLRPRPTRVWECRTGQRRRKL